MIKEKKILFIDSYHNSLYGAQKSMLNLAAKLKERNLEVVIASVAQGDLLKEAGDKGFNIFCFNLNHYLLRSVSVNNTILKKLWYLCVLLLTWCKILFKYILKVKKYDIICINDIRTCILLLPLIIIYQKKMIWYIRIREEQKKIVYILSHFFSIVIFISSDLQEATHLSKTTKTEKLLTGFPNHDLKFQETNLNEVKFVTVGSINARKNQIEVLDVFKRLDEKINFKCTLDIIGSYEPEDYDYYKKLEKKISDDLLLKYKVKIKGYSNNVISELERYDVFIFSSLREGLPRSVIEALQAGLYVITRPVDGIKDIILMDDLGFIYTRLDEFDDFTVNKISLYTKNKNLKLARNAFINKRFDNDKYVDDFLKIINSLLGKA
ncbi:glycosyltransferase [Enterobacter hormaechei]|uniref:glycosyltransferase family 4 protein n=1 Tax=Enterobacter hormaechei TaxID=158836 RepID=UPI0018D0CE07|nr:glycosyltransferase family 4 protein [Enterobacter hormaechei]MBH0221298.1 glycosyltransferase [Enterobacter hormaechei]QPO58314.1 glycosyltransferase [Enterobacter hormaechei]QPO63516.1 glycosyltransferase [Enterobacter hormaechei]QPO67388.1 glycosyltransferase [Enterobacter hormaechei]QPP00450.1 glycosyltransferase family 4 protein [Enterobacter hormaechei]